MPCRGTTRAGVVVALAVVGLLAGCTSTPDDEVRFDAADEAAPVAPVDDDLDVADAPPVEAAPDADARLATGGWPEAAAFVAREAEDGNPTLVNLFASWCGPCRAEMPMLLEARDANPDVTFLGIDHMDRMEDGEEFVEEFGIDFATIHDLDGDVAFNIGARVNPTTVVFDADGRLAGRVVGELTASSLDGLLDAVR